MAATGKPAAYKVVAIDLSVQRDQFPIPGIPNGAVIRFFGVLSRPAGTTVFVKFGSGADSVPFTDNWVGINFAPPHNGGAYLTFPAQAGTMQLLIGFDNC